MALENKLTEEQLFDQLISSLVHSAWVSLGKIKNPVFVKKPLEERLWGIPFRLAAEPRKTLGNQ